jgi:hypothetical protein
MPRMNACNSPDGRVLRMGTTRVVLGSVDPMTKEDVRKTTDPSIVEWRGLLAFYLSQLDDGRRTDLTVEKMRETGTSPSQTMAQTVLDAPHDVGAQPGARLGMF